VTSELRSRIKRLMSDCNDDFVRDQVVFTSFIGNIDDDDILVVLKNGRYMIFDNSGRLVRLEATFKIESVNDNNEVKHMFLGEKELSKFTIVDTLNVMTKNENFLKLLMLNKDTDDYLTAELKPSLPRLNTIKSYKIKLSFDNDPQQESFRIKMNKRFSFGLLHG
jgi:hypothetical protein